MVRYRLATVAVLAALLVAILGVQSATAGSPIITRLQIELWGTSPWQSITIEDAWIGAYKVEAASPGATVQRGSRAIVLKGVGGAASTTVSLLLEVNPSVSSYTVKLAKDKTGEAHVQAFRTNGVAPTQFLSMKNYKTFGDATVTTTTSRSALVGEGYNMPMLDGRRPVLAFYYPWFNSGFSFSSPTWYDRPSSAWRTDLPAQIRTMVDQAGDAGVNGFIVSWDGEKRGPHLDMVMDAARDRGNFSVTVTLNVLYWYENGKFDLTGILDGARDALSRSSDPVFLRSADGRPVMFVYGAHQLGIDDWKTIKGQLAASGVNPFFVGEAVPESWGFEGVYTYNPNSYGYSDLVSRNVSTMRALRYQAQVDPSVKQRLWAATVSPGQNMSYFKPLFPEHRDRNGGQRYNQTWNAAMDSAPEWVLITSWNEWYEATHIAPSEKFGYTALEVTKARSAAFRNPPPGGNPSSGGSGLLNNLPIPLKIGSL